MSYEKRTLTCILTLQYGATTLDQSHYLIIRNIYVNHELLFILKHFVENFYVSSVLTFGYVLPERRSLAMNSIMNSPKALGFTFFLPIFYCCYKRLINLFVLSMNQKLRLYSNTIACCEKISKIIFIRPQRKYGEL